MRRLLFFLALLLLTASTGAQTREFDSIRTAISTATSDTQRLRMLDSIGAGDFVWSYPDTSLLYADEELALARRLGLATEEAYALNNRAWAYVVLGRYMDALRDAMRLDSISAGLADPMPNTLEEITFCEIYRDQGDYYRALDHAFSLRDKAARNFRKDPHYATMCQLVIGMVYGKFGQLDSALYYIRGAYDARWHFHLAPRGILTSELATVYSKSGNLPLALSFYHEAVAEIKAEGITKDLITTYNGMSRTFLQAGQLDSAIYYARATLGLGRRTFYRLGKIEAAHLLAEGYKTAGRTDSAWKYLDIYIAGVDSSFSEKQVAAIASLTYNTQLQRQELAARQQQRLSNFRFWGLLALLVAILLITVIAVRNASLRRKNDRLRFEKMTAGLRQQAKELEMQVLRSQMNPHFIFNCLNAINRFILMSEPQTASDYLTKFSRLIRMVLNHSRKASIPLEEELVMLGLYLDLERLRFKDSFDYTIDVDPTLDQSAVTIPPLLLQPFVENAIWHGLLHKKTQGRLTVRSRPDADMLRCEIEDNGIGRARASELRSKSAELKKSMGIDITRTRLALFNRDAGNNGSVRIEDLYDEQGRPAGTRVVLMVSSSTLSIPAE